MTNTPTDKEIAEARKYYDWLIEPDPDGTVRINYAVRFLGKVLTRHDADQERIRRLNEIASENFTQAVEAQDQLTAANERIRELERNPLNMTRIDVHCALEAAREALRKYGRHKKSCNRQKFGDTYVGCNCGLDEEIKQEVEA